MAVRTCKKCGAVFEGSSCPECQREREEAENERYEKWRQADQAKKDRKEMASPVGAEALRIMAILVALAVLFALAFLANEGALSGETFFILVFSGLPLAAICEALSNITNATWRTAYHSRKARECLERMERASREG